MEPMPNSGMPAYGSTQVTISANESSNHLVLRLKNRENILKNEESKLKTELENSVNTLGQSALGNSAIQNSQEISNLNTSGYYPINVSEEGFDSDEAAYQCMDIKEQLDLVQEEKNIVNDGIQIVQTHEQEAVEITTLQLLGRHLSNIMASEGTTFLSTLVTGGAALYLGGPIIGAGMGLIAGNEFLKMAFRYVKQGGASDHLLMIGTALEKIETNNELSEKSIKRAIQSQEDINGKIGEIDIELDKLADDFKSAVGQQSENIEQAMIKLKECRGALIQQSHDLEQAHILLKKSQAISMVQSEQLKSLLSAEYKIENEGDLNKVIEQINLAITSIKANSDDAYICQTKALSYLLKAIDEKNKMIPMNHELTSALMQIELLNMQLGKSEEKIEKVKIKNKELKEEVAKTGEELDKLKEINKEDKIELKNATDNLEAEKSKEHWGETSTIYGVAIAGGTGAAIGLILAGPTAALALGGMAFVKFGTAGARAVHRARLVIRKNELEKKKLELEGLQQGLESSGFNKEGKVSVTAEYGYSQGSYLGTKTLKGVWNVTGYVVNYAAGKEIMGEYKSSHAGVVKCVIGNIPIAFDFDKTTGPSLTGALVPSHFDVSNSEAVNAAYQEYVKYGAITQIDQANLSQLLIIELEKGTVTAPMILDLLGQMSEVQIGNEVIAMIRVDSPLTEMLRIQCKAMLEDKGLPEII